MDNYATLTELLVLMPFAIFLIHAALSWGLKVMRKSEAPPQISAFAAAMLGNFLVFYLAWKLVFSVSTDRISETIFGVLYVFLVYNGIGFCYFHFFNASETSLHVHILMQVMVAKSVRPEQLRRKYSAKEMIESRIDRMIGLGQLKAAGNGWIITNNRTLLVAGGIFDAWRRLLRMPLNPES